MIEKTKALIIIFSFFLATLAPCVAQEGDPYCFLPLEASNSWTFQFATASGLDTVIYSITDTLVRNGKVYHFLDSPLNFDYIRYDNAGHIFQYLPQSELEILLFDFTAEAPDTHRIEIPTEDLLFDVILHSRTEVVEVPAGTFENCLHFTIDYFPGAIDDEQEVWFAPKVGLVRTYPIFDTADYLISTIGIDGCQGGLSAAALYFPIQPGNRWKYKFAQSFAEPREIDSMKIIQKVDLKGYRYYRFDKYLPVFNLSNESFDSTLVRVDGNQVYVLLDSTEFLWYDFDLAEEDTLRITIPVNAFEPGDSATLSVWKEVKFSPVFLHEEAPYEVTTFHFFPRDPFSPVLPVVDQFVEPWGLAGHSHGGIDPIEYYLIEAFVNGEHFDLTTVSVDKKQANVPADFHLFQNYPNPFNPGTTIEYELAKPSRVTLTIYNLLGQHVRTLVDGKWQVAGKHQVSWNGLGKNAKSLAGSLYIYELKSSVNITRRKMVLLR